MPRNQIQDLLDQEYAEDPRRGRDLRLQEPQRLAPWTQELPALPPKQVFERRPQDVPERRPDQPRVLSESEQKAAEAIAGAIMTPAQGVKHGLEFSAAARRGDPQGMGLSALELAALLAPGPKLKGLGAKPAQSLEELVHYYQSRPSVLDYSQYLENPGQVVGNRDRRFVSQEPGYKGKIPTKSQPIVDALNDPARLDHLRELRDAGLYNTSGLPGTLFEGRPVSPWYWPSPLWKAWEKELGPEEAHRRLGDLLSYNAATSMETRVPRNIVESLWADYANLNDIPFKSLGAGVFTGRPFQNKTDILGDIAEGRGFAGESQHKIRNYDHNLRGVGTWRPEYDFNTGERLMTPVTLDSIMAREKGLINQAGEPSQRFAGPLYREGMKVQHKLGEEVGTADVQPPIWQTAQYRLHGDPSYWDSYARIFDDVVHRVAHETGKSPDRTLKEIIHGTLGEPPNIYAAAPLVPPAGILLGSGLYGNDEGQGQERETGGAVNLREAGDSSPRYQQQPTGQWEIKPEFQVPHESYDWYTRPQERETMFDPQFGGWGVGIRGTYRFKP